MQRSEGGARSFQGLVGAPMGSERVAQFLFLNEPASRGRSACVIFAIPSDCCVFYASSKLPLDMESPQSIICSTRTCTAVESAHICSEEGPAVSRPPWQ
jgi:hypothetical protein